MLVENSWKDLSLKSVCFKALKPEKHMKSDISLTPERTEYVDRTHGSMFVTQVGTKISYWLIFTHSLALPLTHGRLDHWLTFVKVIVWSKFHINNRWALIGPLTYTHTPTRGPAPMACTICIIVFPLFSIPQIALDFSIRLSPSLHIVLCTPDGKRLHYKQIQFPQRPTNRDRDCGEGIHLRSNWAWQQWGGYLFPDGPDRPELWREAAEVYEFWTENWAHISNLWIKKCVDGNCLYIWVQSSVMTHYSIDVFQFWVNWCTTACLTPLCWSYSLLCAQHCSHEIYPFGLVCNENITKKRGWSIKMCAKVNVYTIKTFKVFHLQNPLHPRVKRFDLFSYSFG